MKLEVLTGLIVRPAFLALTLMIAGIAVFSPTVYGQLPGALDASFDGDGKVINTVASEDTANAAARQADGKLIVVGTAKTKVPNVSFGVLRMNQDGSLDSTFGGGDGSVTVAIGGLNSFAYATAIQPDGKILVGGRQGTGFDSHFAVARLNPDGSLDTSFDGDGMLVINLGTNTVHSILLQPDGKIVLVGIGVSETVNNHEDFTVVRLNADGSLDTSFDGNGLATTQVGAGNGFDYSYAGALQPDGKIVVTGFINAGINDKHIAVVRYNPDGSVDTTFDEDGKTTVPLDAPLGAAYAVAVQPDGKIVIGGRSSDYSMAQVNFTLIRLNANGALDATFDGDGKLITQISVGGASEISALVIQPDGKILAAGYHSSATLSISGIDFALARYNPDGSLDASFDGDGILISPTANEEDRARALVLDTNGKIFVAGFRAQNTWRQYEFTVLKLNGDGSRDTGFSTDGVVSAWVGENDFSQEQINALAVQRDGKIIAVGASRDAFALARYNPNGSLDLTFDGDGRVMVSPLNDVNNQSSSAAEGVAIQPDGKIVVVGYVFNFGNSSYDFVVTRLTADGSLDNSFDGDGKFVGTLNQSTDVARSVVIQADGKILIAGESELGTNVSNFLLARFNPNGSYDTTFNGSGIVTTQVDFPRSGATSIALQSDGKIVAAGYSRAGQSSSPVFAAARYNANGTLDTTFDGDGKVLNGAGNFLYSVAIQPDGKIVLGGGRSNGFSLARLLANGAVDTNFGDGGAVLTLFGAVCEGRKMVLQGDGKILMAGFTRPTQFASTDFMLARYNSNGTLDTSFDADGIVTTQMSADNDEAYAVAVQPDGKILAAGKAKTPNTNDDFAMARYFSGFTPALAGKAFDFDGDGKADVSVFRPSDGTWYLNLSSQGFTAAQFGISTDKIAPADYDGDGKTDFAVFRDNTWYLLRSTAGFTAIQFGAAGDVPQPADFDGDGRAELAVFRPSSGTWFTLNLVNNQFNGVQFGISTDKPVVGDYDGDGKADYAVYRPADGTWYLLRSSQGFTGIQFGIADDKTVPADYDGDGKTDLGVYRDGTWYLLRSTQGFAAAQFGVQTDLPAPADFDGDGKADLVVFRPASGSWYLLRTTAGFTGFQFGANGDIPTPNAFVR